MANQDGKTIKTDEMEIQAVEKENCKVELEIVPLEPLKQKAKKQAIKDVSKEVSLPGFRKGKVPENMIVNKFGEQVKQQLQKVLANMCFSGAMKELKYPLANPNATIVYNTKDSEKDKLVFTFSFETEPKVPSTDLSKFQLKDIEKPEIAQKDIDEGLRQILFFHAEWEPIAKRPVKDGDYVILDIEDMDQDPPEMVFRGTRFEVRDAMMAKWLKDLVIGKELNAQVEGKSFPDADASEQDKKDFKEKKVRVTIKKIEEAHLPELDDNFAKQTGAENVEQMRNTVKNILEQKAEEKLQSEKRNQVNQFLIDNTSFELPQSLINEEKNFRLNQQLANPRFKVKWNKLSDKEKKQIEEDIEKQANISIKLFYLSKKIIEDHKIVISPEEVKHLALSLKRTQNESELNKNDMANAYSHLLLFKAQDYILEQSSKKS